MKRLWSILAVLVTSGLLSGCLCSFCQEKISPAVKVLPGPPIMFSGQVISNFGERVAGATVRVNGQTTTTNQDGLFRLPAFLAWRYLLTIEKDGYGLFSGTFSRGVTDITWTVTKATVWDNQDPNASIEVKDTLSIEGCQGAKPRTFNPKASPMYEYRSRTPERRKAFAEAASAIAQPKQCSPGIRLAIPPGSLEYEDGKLLSLADRVTVSLATVDLFSQNGLPGDFTFVRRSEGQIVERGFMESFGAGSVTVKANGRPLRLKAGSSATLVIPVDPNQLKRTTPPETIPLLVFDKSQGVWVHEGTATLGAGGKEYVAQVTHFSEYNADVEFTQPACIKINATAIGENFDLWQKVLDANGIDYHPKLHSDLTPGTHAVWALPPIDNPPLDQGLAISRTGHKIVLTAYKKNSCPTETSATCEQIDQEIRPKPANADVVKQDVNTLIPTPPGYTECKEQVIFYKDPTQVTEPLVTATAGPAGGVTVSWVAPWDSTIAADNEDGFEVEERVCAPANVITTPTWRCGNNDQFWDNWHTPQHAGAIVARAKTAKDGNAGTDRTTQMDTATFPRLPGLYKYRVRAYYHQAALADPGNPNAGYTSWSDDAVQPTTKPDYWASIGAGRLRIVNNLPYVAPNASYQDTWVSRLRISLVPQTMVTDGMATAERLQSDGFCGTYGDSLWDVPPNGTPKPPSITNFGWVEPNSLNSNIPLPLSNYYLYIGLGHWYLWNGYSNIGSTLGTGVTCSNPTNYAKHLGGFDGTTYYFHRSVGGIIPVPGLTPGTIIPARSNYVAVQDHFTGTLTIEIGGTPLTPTIIVKDQNNIQIQLIPPLTIVHPNPTVPCNQYPACTNDPVH